MSTKSGHEFNQAAFEKLRRIAPNILEARRLAQDGNWHARPLPEEVAFKLTNRCDLRCTHCYQWNEVGYHHNLTPADKHDDLDLHVIARVLTATRALRSNVYLWGGEPLLYRDWDGLVELLAEDPRWTAVCTNGTLIERRLDSLMKISRHLEVSVSLDGFETEHDSIRGKGSFQRTMQGIRLLVERKKAYAYLGEVTINFVLSDGMVGRMFDFMEFLEQEGIDTVYVSFPWHISHETAAKMDRYYATYFSWDGASTNSSWHSYRFKLDPGLIDTVNAETARLDAREWKLKLRYNPRLDSDDMRPFVLGSDKPAQNKTSCHSIRTRMDVFPNGDVISCKFFPEFHVGNLKEKELHEVWHGDRFNQVRETVSRCGLMPVCAKCNLLYTRGI